MMKKNSTKGYVILGILFALVSIIAFVVPTTKTVTFWIAYVFTAAAFAVQIGIWKTALGEEETLKSKFLGFPVVHIGIVYAIFQVIAFAVFMFVPTLPAWSAIVVCSVIAGVSVVFMISAEAGRDEIERVETKVKQKVFYIKSLQLDVELLAKNESDSTVKEALQELAEKIRFSDPMSLSELEAIEKEIANKTNTLKSTADKLTVIAEIDTLLTERNAKVKILK